MFALFLGLVIFAILNFIISHTHLVKEKGKFEAHLTKTAYLVTIGLILHDFPEGFALPNSYISSQSLGVLIAICIAAHNIPEEFAIAAPLTLVKKKSFLFRATFISALAEPFGAFIGIFAVHFISALNPIFISFAAGAMIFVALHEMLPLALKYKKNKFILFWYCSKFVCLCRIDNTDLKK